MGVKFEFFLKTIMTNWKILKKPAESMKSEIFRYARGDWLYTCTFEEGASP